MVCWGRDTERQTIAPLPAVGFTALAAGGHLTAGLRMPSSVLTGTCTLTRLTGSGNRLLFTQVWRDGASMPDETRISPLTVDGQFDVAFYSKPPMTVRFGSVHYLWHTAEGVHPANGPIHVELVNGDADGDNSVTLFDYLVLDGQFGVQNTLWADLDGDGEVTLFDYLVVDATFGAQGD